MDQENTKINKKINKKINNKIDNDMFLLMFLIFVIIISIYVFIFVLNSPKNCILVYIGKSNIEGDGIMALRNINKGDKIFIAIDDYNSITYLGSKINHCNNPSAELVKNDKVWYVVALYDIEKNKEITVDYNKTPDFIKKPDPSWTC